MNCTTKIFSTMQTRSCCLHKNHFKSQFWNLEIFFFLGHKCKNCDKIFDTLFWSVTQHLQRLLNNFVQKGVESHSGLIVSCALRLFPEYWQVNKIETLHHLMTMKIIFKNIQLLNTFLNFSFNVFAYN